MIHENLNNVKFYKNYSRRPLIDAMSGICYVLGSYSDKKVRIIIVEKLPIENVTFFEFVENPHLHICEADRYWHRRGIWITAEMDRRGWSWIVICGGEVVGGSAAVDEFPSDEAKVAIGEEHDRIPFVYSKAIPHEEFADLFFGISFRRKKDRR